MIDVTHVPPVEGDELLTRFIVNGNEVRTDGTVRPQLFLPYKRVELSVNRHRDATLEETWSIGQQVAACLDGVVDASWRYGRESSRVPEISRPGHQAVAAGVLQGPESDGRSTLCR